MKKIYFSIIALLVSVSTFAGLSTEFTGDAELAQASFTTFSVSGETADAVIDNAAATVLVTLAEGTDVSALVPTFTLTDGAEAAIEQVSQTSGVTAVDFSENNEVVYTIVNGEISEDWTVTIQFGNSINEKALTNVSMYPNPVNDVLTITNLDNAKQVMVSNVIGQIVYSLPVSGIEMNISTSELRSGIYVVTVIAYNGAARSERIIKK